MNFKDFFKKKMKLEEFGKNTSKVNSLSKELATRQNSLSYHGLSNVLPNPDKILRKLGKDVQVYEDILSDSHLYGCVQSRKAGVLALEWEICDLHSEDGESEKLEAVRAMIGSLDMEELIRQILNAPLFGYQPIEIIWRYDGKYFTPYSVQAKPIDWFSFDSENRLRLKTRFSWEGELMNMDRFLLPRHEATYQNPYGNALLSKCYWNIVFKKNGRKFWVAFTEKFGMPWLLGKYLAGTDNKKADEIMSALVGMFRDGIIVHPDSMEVDIKNPGSSSSADIYEKLIQDCRVENSVLILGHTGASLSTPGKLGNEEMALKAAQRVIDSDKRLVEKTINQLISIICKFNFNGGANPEFRFFEEENIRKDLAERDKLLINSGVKFNKDYFISAYNLNERHFDL